MRLISIKNIIHSVTATVFAPTQRNGGRSCLALLHSAGTRTVADCLRIASLSNGLKAAVWVGCCLDFLLALAEWGEELSGQWWKYRH